MDKPESISYPVLVPNMKGLETAVSSNKKFFVPKQLIESNAFFRLNAVLRRLLFLELHLKRFHRKISIAQ